ncbi:hypothetical protein TBLA_0B06420 [Henningerozyma blattae CBS 6284]|uniref:Malic enzyme n=1 Tax=Henningerozyma blattae (strain ATCC 34711 / CBS 6284 / DSM 70876 / NBRC 10599 / NRRL Y-10934 / UCD 77-7) TaxID=1071380 RepID=I2GZB3_HENB6|nr:hypothetical protein TBLA_0B06420 [Tetrapisispora blattae CBS 6284]CCH59465.1 hypothetical protein TBLA_0B06420 [Tetrapisispora blattae CBS 6284]
MATAPQYPKYNTTTTNNGNTTTTNNGNSISNGTGSLERVSSLDETSQKSNTISPSQSSIFSQSIVRNGMIYQSTSELNLESLKSLNYSKDLRTFTQLREIANASSTNTIPSVIPIPVDQSLKVDNTIKCSLYGRYLINSPLFNKHTAFTKEERLQFGLTGLLPSKIETLEEQLDRAYSQLNSLPDKISKNDYMSVLRQQNKTLYFALISHHLKELIPIIYTPTEGDAIAEYSNRIRQPEGCFLDIMDQESIPERLSAFGEAKDIDYIVVSDSEGILGIGDQGVGGVRISISKMALMTVCGGIHPGRVLPVVLDVGTNNQGLIDDPMYVGNKFPRVRGAAYDEFIKKFIDAVKTQFPNAVLHFEDFGFPNARRILDRYRDEVNCFNDDIQGTGAVVMSSLIAALNHTNQVLKDIKVLVFGAGTAGLGIADQIVSHMIQTGISIQEARSKIYLMNVNGIILESQEEISTPGQMLYAKDDKEWDGIDTKSLFEAVSKIKPTCLIGCSTVAGAFNEKIIKEMYKHNARPIVFPLSNPTRLHEAKPEDVMKWTNNDALMATGSPFANVDGYRISENNNCFSFPGIGLGALLARSTHISDSMISAAVDELASLSPLKPGDSKPGLLPKMDDIRETSARVATAVLLQAIREGSARVEHFDPTDATAVRTVIPRDFDECLQWVQSRMWNPVYRPMVRVY